MKNAKRVLISLIALAVLVSGMFVYSFADDQQGTDDGSTVLLPDYADVLKYYDPVYSKLYENEDFEDGAYSSSVILMDAAKDYTETTIKNGDDNKYLAIQLGHFLNPNARTYAAYSVALGGDTISKAVINARISASHIANAGKVCPACQDTFSDVNKVLCSKCGTELQLVETKAPSVGVYLGDTAGMGALLLEFNFEKGTVAYYNGADYSYVDGLTVTEEAWYDIAIVCDGTQYKFVITAGDDVYETEALNSPAFTFKRVNIGCGFAADNRDGIIMIDDVFVQAGLENRTVGIDVAAKTNEGLDLILAMLNDETYTAEVKLAVIEVFDTLIDGIYSDVVILSEDSIAVIEDIRASMLTFFASQLKLATDVIDTSASYSVRLALVENNVVFANRVRALLDIISEEGSAAAEELLAKYDTEVSALAELKDHSDEFIEYINKTIEEDASIFASDDYSVLKAFIDETVSLFEVDGVPTYSSTYPLIKDALTSYTAVYNKYVTGLKNSQIFCECVAKAALIEDAADTLTDEQFAEGLAAYETAAKLGFSNTTFPGMAEALVKFEALNSLEQLAVVAERFMDYVATAEQAIYIFLKEEWLDLAGVDYDTVEIRYPGVKEAKELYDSLRAEIAQKKAAADLYIAAVNNISGKTGNDLIAAIDYALSLRDAGNVAGYAGVAEANIALDNASKSRDLDLAYAAKFVKLVANIKDAKTLTERFEAITLASEAQGYALENLEGVSSAKAELVSAVSLYNSEIASINNSYKAVASNAGDLSGACTSLSDIIKLVVSFVKGIAG